MTSKHMKKKFNMICHWEITNQNDTTQLLEQPKSKILTIPNAGKDVEQQDHSIAGVNAKWYSHFGRQFGNFLQN